MKIKIEGTYHIIIFYVFVQPKPYISGRNSLAQQGMDIGFPITVLVWPKYIFQEKLPWTWSALL